MREIENELLTPINNRDVIKLVIWCDQTSILIVILLWAFFDGHMLSPMDWILSYLILILIYFALVLPIRLHRRLPIRQSKITITPDYDKERYVQMDEKGLTFESEGIRLYFPLAYIKNVRRLKHSLYIQAVMGFGTSIPYSAFPSESEINAAYLLLSSEQNGSTKLT